MMSRAGRAWRAIHARARARARPRNIRDQVPVGCGPPAGPPPPPAQGGSARRRGSESSGIRPRMRSLLGPILPPLPCADRASVLGPLLSFDDLPPSMEYLETAKPRRLALAAYSVILHTYLLALVADHRTSHGTIAVLPLSRIPSMHRPDQQSDQICRSAYLSGPLASTPRSDPAAL